jgi:lysophospholipase L1-like esterase
LRAAVKTFKTNWDGIIGEIFALRRSRATFIGTMDIYNPYVDEDQAADTWPNDGGNDFQVLNGYLNEVNNHIALTSTAKNIAYAPVHLSFNGPAGTIDPAKTGMLAFDGFHPSAAGHALIAWLLRQQGYVPVVP